MTGPTQALRVLIQRERQEVTYGLCQDRASLRSEANVPTGVFHNIASAQLSTNPFENATFHLRHQCPGSSLGTTPS